jgi:predicted PurR-regulated permease PerM
MNSFVPETSRIGRAAAWMVALAVTIFCLQYFSSVLQPIVIAVMIWYSVFELRRLIQKVRVRDRSLPSAIANLFAFGVIFLIIFGVYEIITLNLEKIIVKSPEYAANFRAMLGRLQTLEQFNAIQDRILDRIKSFDIQPVLTGALNNITSIAGNVFVIIIYVAFLLVEEKYFQKKLRAFSKNREGQEKLDLVVRQIVTSIRKYVLVKTQMSVLTGLVSYFILISFQVDFAALWAFVIFLLNYIPYVGSFVATLLPAAFAMFQFQSAWMFLWVFLVIQIVQFSVGNVLEPKIMGRQLNLSPLGVMVALTFWGTIWGVLGMFLSVPITSVMLIGFSRFESTRFVAVWLSETGELEES